MPDWVILRYLRNGGLQDSMARKATEWMYEYDRQQRLWSELCGSAYPENLSVRQTPNTQG